MRECNAASCFPEATWPKLIGYGNADTEVVDIDRRDSDGMLVLVIKSDEDDLVKNAGTSSNTRSFTAYDVNTETYLWWKVFINVSGSPTFVYITPDGSKVLAAFWYGSERTMVYLDAVTGAQIGTPAKRTTCCPKITARD